MRSSAHLGVQKFERGYVIMINFNFDLESAQYELECVDNLLSIYQDFYAEECPNRNDKDDWKALSFANRAHMFETAIDTAVDKLQAVIKSMDIAIEQHYNKGKT